MPKVLDIHAASDGGVVLHPSAEIPAKEQWLHENPQALAAVREGLSQSSQGEVKSRGSFARYASEEIE